MTLLLRKYMLSLKLLHVEYLLLALAAPFGSSWMCIYVFCQVAALLQRVGHSYASKNCIPML